ncbi:hypothetical protein D3C78_1571320 [compost metagenome]
MQLVYLVVIGGQGERSRVDTQGFAGRQLQGIDQALQGFAESVRLAAGPLRVWRLAVDQGQ